MRLHIGCGTIFLQGYINIDAAPHYLKENAPKEILIQNTTTLDEYYKYGFCKGSGICIADVKARIEDLSQIYKKDEIEEIIFLHVLEHFPFYKAHAVLKELYEILKPNGRLYIAVPDIIKTAKLLCNSITFEEEDWAIRLIHGTQRNEFSHHYCSYTERTLKNLLDESGFGDFNFLPNINFYPAIHLEAFKIG